VPEVYELMTDEETDANSQTYSTESPPKMPGRWATMTPQKALGSNSVAYQMM
jgi:hypothetical protein